MEQEQYKTLRFGSKVYRYVDSDGKKGHIHFAKRGLTPVEQVVSGDKTYVNLDGQNFEINSMQELDIIDDALNNYDVYLQKVLQTPSRVIAKTDPNFYKKILYAVRSSVVFHSDPYRSGKSNVNSVYEELDLIVKKLIKIDREVDKLNPSEMGQR